LIRRTITAPINAPSAHYRSRGLEGKKSKESRRSKEELPNLGKKAMRGQNDLTAPTHTWKEQKESNCFLVIVA